MYTLLPMFDLGAEQQPQNQNVDPVVANGIDFGTQLISYPPVGDSLRKLSKSISIPPTITPVLGIRG